MPPRAKDSNNGRPLKQELQKLVRSLVDDLRERTDQDPALRDLLQGEYQQAKNSGRVGRSYSEWREGELAEAAVAWVLAGLFIRFLEDNGLLDVAMISGPGESAEQARQARTDYYASYPTHSDRDYLLHLFERVAALPAMRQILDRDHNPLWRLPISGDAAKHYWEFWRRVDPDTGELVHAFASPDWDTRFLGDLYEELSEYAQKTYALRQTPEFVESFILDRTLDPAIDTFGFEQVRLLDPTCGSGHFLLGAFERLLYQWQQNAPGLEPRKQIQNALSAVHGVDINGFAVSIARFRLLIAALKAEGIIRLRNAPGYHFNLATGDSLLHGRRFEELDLGSDAEGMQRSREFGHCFAAEDQAALSRILGQQYHAVVGNPPYITVKDSAVGQLYRNRFRSCHRQYSLGVPFTERFFQLALIGNGGPAGYVGMITTNSFMKREFGKKLIEEYLPSQDLTHVIDTSGAYIPGHGTPTVILFGRHRKPVSEKVRAVLGIRGEPSTPKDPERGLVWLAITGLIDVPGKVNDFVSVGDLNRGVLGTHPWSLQGGYATEVVQAITHAAKERLDQKAKEIGFGVVTREDEAYRIGRAAALRHGVAPEQIRPLVAGDEVRDWALQAPREGIWPYDLQTLSAVAAIPVVRLLWPYRTQLADRVAYGKTQLGRGLLWFEYSMFFRNRARIPLSITFAFVATHNHFVLDRGGKVFNRTAPVIKLPEDATEKDHLALLGLLNSSTACFWMQQVFHNKGGPGGGSSKDEKWHDFYEHDGTKLAKMPLCERRPDQIARVLDDSAQARSAKLPAALHDQFPLARSELDAARAQTDSLLGQMIAWQEELDWWCYRAYGLLDDDLCHAGTPPEVALGERAVEIVLARRMQSGEQETSWFRRHGSTPITEIPEHWPADYRALVRRRIDKIESDNWIGLLERPEYKRRWKLDRWEDLEQDALRDWLLERLEMPRCWPEYLPRTTRQLAHTAETDADFMAVAELYVGQTGFDVARLVADLVQKESVPLLPVLRYKPSGLRKRAEWERTWALQRAEDRIDDELAAALTQGEDESEEDFAGRLKQEQAARKRKEVGEVPVPPKYKQADFLGTTFWRLRGGLDVPKERFFSLPHCSPDGDDSLLVGWGGWNALPRMHAVARCYTERREEAGWEAQRLAPLLGAMDELLPWVQQWHNGIDPEYGERLGDFFATFLQTQRQELGLTAEAVRAWQPPAGSRRRGRRSIRAS